MEITDRFQQYCKVGMEKYSTKELDYANHEWSSYQKASEGMERFGDLMLENAGEVEIEEVAIYMEIICHSYNDEMKQRLMSILSLVGIKYRAISFLCALITLAEMKEDAQGMVNGISADISALDSFHVLDEAGPVVAMQQPVYAAGRHSRAVLHLLRHICGKHTDYGVHDLPCPYP